METSDLFKKHFGDKVVVGMFHPNMVSFFEELNQLVLLEDQKKKPTWGDRILINNILADYPCREL